MTHIEWKVDVIKLYGATACKSWCGHTKYTVRYRISGLYVRNCGTEKNNSFSEVISKLVSSLYVVMNWILKFGTEVMFPHAHFRYRVCYDTAYFEI